MCCEGISLKLLEVFLQLEDYAKVTKALGGLGMGEPAVLPLLKSSRGTSGHGRRGQACSMLPNWSKSWMVKSLALDYS